MANPLVLYDENTNLISVLGVQNAVTGGYINDATVTVTLKDLKKVNLGLDSGSWPVTCSYVSASNGNYQGIVASTVHYPRGRNGFAIVTVTGDTYTAKFEAEVSYRTRKKTT